MTSENEHQHCDGLRLLPRELRFALIVNLIADGSTRSHFLDHFPIERGSHYQWDDVSKDDCDNKPERLVAFVGEELVCRVESDPTTFDSIRSEEDGRLIVDNLQRGDAESKEPNQWDSHAAVDASSVNATKFQVSICGDGHHRVNGDEEASHL